MKSITASLALMQLKNNRKRTIITIIGVVLSVAMLTAVCGFVASAIDALRSLVSQQDIANYSAMFISLAAIFGSIIFIASVIVISNAFRISAAERTRQFGILKSTGATKQQITKTVLYEALYLSAVAIPIGIIAGLLLQWLGSSIGDALLSPMNKLINNGYSIHMQFVFAWQAVLLALFLSFFTIMLSAWLPARKAAAIPAIEAIRLTQEIKLNTRKPRTHRLASLLFGIEGKLAAKSMRRSRRSYYAMVAALTISVVLFLVCGSLDTQLSMTMNQSYLNVDATTQMVYGIARSSADASDEALDDAKIKALGETLSDYPDTQLYGIGTDDTYTARIDETALTEAVRSVLEDRQTEIRIVLAVPDPVHYEAICQAAGVPIGSNILINSMQWFEGNRQNEFQALQFSRQSLTLHREDTVLELPLHAQLTGAQVPQEVVYASSGMVTVVVQRVPVKRYCWFGNSADSDGYAAYAQTAMQDYNVMRMDDTGSFYTTHIYTDVTDISAVTDMTRSLTKLITIFLYGFVGLLSLIGLTSVISAIAANVQLRAREFAALVSVGMTQSGVRRMLALESIMSACKALVYGLPLGSLAMVLSYFALTKRNGFQFVYPWLTALEAVAAILLIAVITAQYAATKLRKGSIMDVIRATEGA